MTKPDQKVTGPPALLPDLPSGQAMNVIVSWASDRNTLIAA